VVAVGARRTAAIALVVALVGLVGPAAGAEAARLVSSSPAQGAVVEQAPASVVLTFDVPVASATVVCTDTFGNRVPLAAPVASGRKVTTKWPADQKPGLFRFGWTVRTAAGKAVLGVLTFSYNALAPTASPSPGAPSPTPSGSPAATSGTPTSGGPTSSAPPSGPEGSSVPWALVAAAVAAVMLLGLLVVLLLRRRSRPRAGRHRSH
jgi:methionine-rich copper-binding protein CopC